MLQWMLKKIIGTKNQRDIKRLRPVVAQINELEEKYQLLSEEELRAKTQEFKDRLAQGATLDSILCEAFAVVKNACRRLSGQKITICHHEMTWEMIPFDVQIIGGLVLHSGKISEMATGEGKTLVATMPAYLNALTGQGVHIVTVNDYLARRDAEWMGTVYRYLGLTVGCIQNQMMPAERREQYRCDITYGTNSEFGFDYLRDMGMAMRPEELVQRGHSYAIIDEIDSILIDEARTPLIISGPAPQTENQFAALKPGVERLVRRQIELCNRYIQEAKDLLEQKKDDEAQRRLYQVKHGMPKNKQFLHMLEEPSIRRLVEKVELSMLSDSHKEEARELQQELFYIIEEKDNDASLTEKGCSTLSPDDPDAYVVPDLVGALAELDGKEDLTDDEKFAQRQTLQEQFSVKSERIHSVDQLIRAYAVYEKDVEYVVQENQVLIVDEYTGRIMPGRRWSDGLHQAIEAKEGVKVEGETQTLATITIQNYFRMYQKLSGMTGTAETEADEFHQIYKLDVVVIPTNRPVRRLDANDQVYKTQREKFNAVIDDIEACHKRSQPVLVGTISVESSELLSRMLKRRGIPHNVLNAKNHEREAEIVMNAGQPGSVTIATNMAGRGTDIKLGPGVVHIDRQVIQSQAGLDDKVDGKTLREILKNDPCGLRVIGTERHESRRIDRQLRGRCARQGDPGTSRFYVSLEDDLMRLFGSDRVAGIMQKLGLQEGEMLEHPWLNRSIETAQRRVEQQNFAIRKRTLEYDDVMNKQREVIYDFRTQIVAAPEIREHLYSIVTDILQGRVEQESSRWRNSREEAIKEVVDWANEQFPLGLRVEDLADATTPDDLSEKIYTRVKQAYELKLTKENQEMLPHMERYLVLQSIDTHWQDYLRSMDTLRQGVGLRAYGQRDPLVEYRHEAYEMFSSLMDRIKQEVVSRMFRAGTTMESLGLFFNFAPPNAAQMAQQRPGPRRSSLPPAAERVVEHALKAKSSSDEEIGRNDPCPCGSGRKYKKCCGRSG